MGSKFKGDTNMWLDLVKEMSGSKRGGEEPIEEYQTKGEVKDFGSNISFDKAFAKARELGLEIFKWDGKEYGTKTESEYYPNLLPEINVEALGPETMSTMTEDEHRIVSPFQTSEGTMAELPYTSKESAYNFKSPQHEAEYNAAMENGTMDPADMASYFDLSNMFIQEHEFGLSEVDLLKMYRASGSPELFHMPKGDRAHYRPEKTYDINIPGIDKSIVSPHAINIQNSDAGREQQLQETIEELSHAYQYTTDAYPSWIGGDPFMNTLNRGISNGAYNIPLPDSSVGMCYDDNGNPEECGRYSYPGHQEHIAHSMISRGLASEFASNDYGTTNYDADETGQQNYYIKDIDGNIRQGRYVLIPDADGGFQSVKEESIPSNYTIDDFEFVGEMNGHELGILKDTEYYKNYKKYGGSLRKFQEVGEFDGVTVGEDGKLVMSQDSPEKDYLLNELDTEGYNTRWQNEINKNLEFSKSKAPYGEGFTKAYGNTRNIDPDLMTHLRREGLQNTQEYLGIPSEYGIEESYKDGFFSPKSGGLKDMSNYGGLSYQGDRTHIDPNTGQPFEDGSFIYDPKKHYNRLYYGENTQPNNKWNKFKRSIYGNTNHSNYSLNEARSHELGHSMTNNNELITPYAKDLLERSKTLKDGRSDVSYEEWKENINTEKKGSIISNIFSGSSPFTSNLKDKYDEWKNVKSGDYLTDPAEVYTRYKKGQKHLKDAGIFDHTTGQPFTDDDYQKVQEWMLTDDFYEADSDVQEFFGTDRHSRRSNEFNKKIEKNDLIEIMNNVADNSEIGGDDLQQGVYAKYGAELPKAQIGKETVDPSRTNYSDSKNYQRIKNTRDGVRENEDGSHSTHLMADNNKDEAWPTLFQDVNGEWFEPLDAYQEAKLRDEVYKFSTKQAMINFARKGEWKTDVKDIKTFSDAKSMYKKTQYSKGAKIYRRGGEVLPKFETTGEVTSENIVSTDPTTITGKKRKEESYTGEWYEGPYVDYGIEDLFNFHEGKYKDGIDLVEAGKWRSARGFTATDLQYWYYYTQNNIPYGHTQECRSGEGTCLNDDGINPLININQRSTYDGKNYGFVRQDLTGVSDGTLDPKLNDFGWVPKNHTHAHAMARDMRSILGILFFWNGEPYTNEDPTEKGLRTGDIEGAAIIEFENKLSNAKSKQEVLEIIADFKPDLNAQRIMYNKTNPFNVNPDQMNHIMGIRQKHFGDLDMSQTQNYRIAGPVVVNHKEKIKLLQSALDNFPHPDMEDWSNSAHKLDGYRFPTDHPAYDPEGQHTNMLMYKGQYIWNKGSAQYFLLKEQGKDVSSFENDPKFMKRLNYYQNLINFYTNELAIDNPNPEFPNYNKNLPYEGSTWKNQGQWDTYDKGRQKEQALAAEKGIKFFNPETFVNNQPTQWRDFQNKKWVEIGSELQKFNTEEFSKFKTETISYLLKTGRLKDGETGNYEKVEQYIKYLYSGVNTYWANEIFDLVDQELPQFTTKKDKDAFLKTHAFKNHEFNDLSYIDENGEIVKTEDQYIPYMTMYNKTQLYSNGDPFTMIDTPEKALMANQFNLISGPYSKNLLGFKTKWAGFGFDLEKVPHYMPWLKRFAYDELVPGTENEYVRKYVDNPEYNKDTGQWSANAANWISALGPKGDGQDGYLLNDYNQSDWKNILDFTDTEAMFGYKEGEDGKMIMRAGTFNLGQYNDGHYANEMTQSQNLTTMRSDLIDSPFAVDDKVNTSETNAGELSLWGMGAYSVYQLWKKNPLQFGTNLTLREYAKNIALQPIRWGGRQFNNSILLNSSLGSVPGLTSGTSGLTLNNAAFTGFGYHHGTEAIDHWNKGEYGEAAYDATFAGLNILPAYSAFNKWGSLFPESQSFIKNSKLFAENDLFSKSSKVRTDWFNQNAYRHWNYKANQINSLPMFSFNNRLMTTFPKATKAYSDARWLPGSFNYRPSQYSIMSNANKPGGLFSTTAGSSPQGSLNYQFKIDSPLFRNYKSSNYDFLGRFNPQFNPKPLQIGRDPLQLGYNNQPMYMTNADGTRNWNWRMNNITNPGPRGFTMPNEFEKGMYYKSFDNMVKPVDGGFIIK